MYTCEGTLINKHEHVILPLSLQDIQRPPLRDSGSSPHQTPPPPWPTDPGSRSACRAHSPVRSFPSQSPRTHHHRRNSNISWAHLRGKRDEKCEYIQVKLKNMNCQFWAILLSNPFKQFPYSKIGQSNPKLIFFCKIYKIPWTVDNMEINNMFFYACYWQPVIKL